MTTDFLHGVEVIEIDTGLRPIRTVRSSVIGIVGTAPDAFPAATAEATTGTEAANTGITFTAATGGAAGNRVAIRMIHPQALDQATAVTVDGATISVRLATDGSGAILATAADVISAINGAAPAAALVAAAALGTSTGAGIVETGLVTLTGGVDEAFPLNKPTLVVGSRREAARLGTAGTLPAAMDGIFDQAGATVVVVRVAEGAGSAETQVNVIGGVDPVEDRLTGIEALRAAREEVGVTPRILIAPGFSGNVACTTALQSVAEKLRAIAVIDGPDTTDAEAIQFRRSFDSDRLYLVDPWVRVLDPQTALESREPPSARVAGAIAKRDAESGFWWSPSNQIVNGIVGMTRDIDFGMSDPNTRGQLLNAQDVTIITNLNGLRLMGNRTLTTDPLWAFLSVRRTADMIYESIEQAQLWALDRPFSAQLLRDIRDSVAAYLRTLEARGAILGGDVWIDPELNTETTLKAGQLFVDFDIEPPAPLERLTFRAYRNGSYYEELIADVNGNALSAT